MATGNSNAECATVTVRVVPDYSDLTTVPSTIVGRIVDTAAHDLLFQYSEWLDSQGLIVGDNASDDKRSHDQLARDFLAR